MLTFRAALALRDYVFIDGGEVAVLFDGQSVLKAPSRSIFRHCWEVIRLQKKTESKHVRKPVNAA